MLENLYPVNNKLISFHQVLNKSKVVLILNFDQNRKEILKSKILSNFWFIFNVQRLINKASILNAISW